MKFSQQCCWRFKSLGMWHTQQQTVASCPRRIMSSFATKMPI